MRPPLEGCVFDKNWRALYAAAVLEVDPLRQEPLVMASEAAIRARKSLNGEVSSEERAAMQNALDAVGVLKLERAQRKK